MDTTALELDSQLMNKTLKSVHHKSGAKFPVIADMNFQRDMLDAHNDLRTQFGCVSLTWSQELGDLAQEWAAKLAERNVKLFRELPDVGETICFVPISRGVLSGLEVTEDWAAKRLSYDYNTPGWRTDSQEFSQLVWKSSREFGCARSVDGDKSVIVAFYRPGGNTNYPGNFEKNVPKPPAHFVCNGLHK